MSLYIREAGSPTNPSILFLHGGGLSSRMWLPQFERLSDSFYCVAPDLPEHGESLDHTPLTMEHCIAEIAEIIINKLGGCTHVVGLSMGGAIGVTLLSRLPDVVDHLMISGTAQRIGPVYAWLNNLNAPVLKLMTATMGKDKLASFMAQQLGIPPEMHEMIEDIKLLSPGTTLRTSGILAEIDSPLEAENQVLVCVGENETGAAKSMGKKYVATLKNVRGVMSPGGHVWSLQYPALFADTVRAFVTDVPLPAELKSLSGG